MQHPPAHPPPTRTDGCGFDRNNAALDSKWGFGGRTREGWRRETQGGEGRSGWEGARRRSHLLHLLLCCFCPREQKRLVLCACSERTPRALCSPRARRQETSPPSDRGRAWVPLIRRSPTQLARPLGLCRAPRAPSPPDGHTAGERPRVAAGAGRPRGARVAVMEGASERLLGGRASSRACNGPRRSC